ncbi:nuclear pore complex protein NUP205-like [Dioscorea cayenensis subsp. rotundata]|uniref:Nuclear pore complex protein NUP205-like n=1 Tax=Dioscorea cayennensis subsp. rotundata TaxID=55577 RepID=A0AB40C045_DIOCR|nr:nuclear pore complex protein NUP205-like [Dioscorea cayenensis subsp. rotundata]XP_039133080.1 nuclear pore complex protein NUP205-like [Dioscorea cayenensis subsp. rotundata]
MSLARRQERSYSLQYKLVQEKREKLHVLYKIVYAIDWSLRSNKIITADYKIVTLLNKEVKNKILRDIIDFVKRHQSFFDQIMREDLSRSDTKHLECVSLVVSILCKILRRPG